MTTKITSIVAASIISTTTFAQQVKRSHGHVGFIYPLSTNGAYARDYINPFSLHAIAGLSGGETGFCGAGVANIIMGDARGFVASGFYNHIKKSANGLQAAGFINYVKEDADGVQAAGFMNLTGNGNNVQLAGFSNIGRGSEGAQFAGFFNKAKEASVQAAGFVNIAKSVDAAQVAGFINIADDVNTQVAGFINVAKNVKGIQAAGFINIAESSDYPIGLINIIKKGEKNLGLTINENLTIMATFRSGGRILYGIVGVGYNMKSAELLYAAEAGLGAHIPITKGFRLNAEVTSGSLTNFYYDHTYFKSSVRLMPSVMLGNKWEIFAGPTVNFNEHSTGSEGLEDSYLWSTTQWGRFYGLSVGAVGGVQCHL